jgi:RNA polymerase sigma-70 factor, ECF subfamily
VTDSKSQDLLARWRAGDETALAELVERQMIWLHGYVRKRIGAHLRVHDDSVDFVQLALTDVLTSDTTIRIDDEHGLRALLAQIVDNDLKDRNKWLKREKRDPAREAGGATESVLRGAFKEVTTPSVAAHRRETSAWMLAALDELAPEDREVIRLHEWERLSHAEIGERLGISTDAARVRFQRALPRLALKVAEQRRHS